MSTLEAQTNSGTHDILTVVLLTYNHEDTIARAFDSIVEQKTTFPFRILVLEDASSDHTAATCVGFKDEYPEKVQLILNDSNQGVVRTLKNGLLAIRSRYFAFLEGDEFWCDEYKLQKQVDAPPHPPDTCAVASRIVKRDGNVGMAFTSRRTIRITGSGPLRSGGLARPENPAELTGGIQLL